MKISPFILFHLFLLFSCGKDLSEESAKAAGESKVVARVGAKKLYLHDLKGILPPNVSPSDSADLCRRFAENWVKKELMLQEAKKKAKLDEAEIERKVEDYRYSLTLYEFEKQYIEKELDTLIAEPVLKKYYQDNIVNFVLKQPIVKAAYVKIDKKNVQLGRIRSLISSKDNKELVSLCARYAEQYHLNDSTWVDFENLINRTPWSGSPNKATLLQTGKQTEVSERDFVYLLHVYDARQPGQTAPLEFAVEQIRSLILNQRKVNLVNALGKQVYESAKAKKEFEIY